MYLQQNSPFQKDFKKTSVDQVIICFLVLIFILFLHCPIEIHLNSMFHLNQTTEDIQCEFTRKPKEILSCSTLTHLSTITFIFALPVNRRRIEKVTSL